MTLDNDNYYLLSCCVDHSHESEGSQNNTEDIGMVDHQYANKGPLWYKRLCPQQEQIVSAKLSWIVHMHSLLVCFKYKMHDCLFLTGIFFLFY